MVRNYGTFRYLIFLLLLCLKTYEVSGSEHDLKFRQISPPGGFTFGAINKIIEDKYGFIWFSSQHGLFRYDTQTIRKFTHIPSDSASIPSNIIHSISRDPSGTLWFGTEEGLCRYDYSSDKFCRYSLEDTVNKTIIKGPVLQQFWDTNNRLWFLNNNKLYVAGKDSHHTGPLVIDTDNKLISFIYLDPQNRIWVKSTSGNVFRAKPPYSDFRFFSTVTNNLVQSMLVSSDEKLWIGYEWMGADCYNANGEKTAHYGTEISSEYDIRSNRVRKIFEDLEGNIWFGTYKGLVIKNKDNGLLFLNSNNTKGLSHSSIYDIFLDSNNGIWVGTWSGTLSYANPFDNAFSLINSKNGLSNDVVSSLAELNNIIWIGTEGGGLNTYNPRSGEIIQHFLNSAGSPQFHNIKSLKADQNNTLWVGTFNDGLWRLEADSYKAKSIKTSKVINGGFYDLEIEGDTLWAGSFFQGLYKINTSTGDVQKIPSSQISSNQIRALLLDSRGWLWIGTNNGLNLKRKEEQHFRVFLPIASNPNSISGRQIYDIFEDHKKNIWIGTSAGLNKFNVTSESFTRLTPESGLPGYEIYGITQDENHNLWLSTDNGISQLNPDSFKIRNFSASDGLQANQFNPAAVFKDSNGIIYFGGPNGISFFNPEEIRTNTVRPQTVITGIFINNKLQTPEKKGILTKSILASDHISLKHNQNSLIFRFVANNFLTPEKNKFKYRLLNYNNNWINSGTDQTATFTKIPPGDYIFQLKAANNDGFWSESPTRLSIAITSPWWQTWYAYTFYFVLLSILILLTYKEISVRHNLKHEIQLEKIKSTSEKKLNQAKLQFFTNISHEIKTPLSLILYPLESLINRRQNDPELVDQLKTLARNGKRLKNILHQVIDIRRIEVGKLPFNPQKTDIIPIIKEVIDCFSLEAKEREINFIFHAQSPELFVTIDPEKFDKIIFNIIANAFKFTKNKGQITVKAGLKYGKPDFLLGEPIDGNYVEFSVFNSDSFIEASELKAIFDRFRQGQNDKKEGTGIGLHMVKEYLHLHHGNISAFSDQQAGTSFIVRTPQVKTETPVLLNEITEQISTSKAPLRELPEIAVLPDKKKLILIIEDNAELRSFLKKALSEWYSTMTAPDGTQGLNLLEYINPDVVLCDVMMPGLNGFEVCETIKRDINLSHIPVILLTALSDDENKIKGYKTGADAYIPKPFEEKLLITRINNLIEARQRLKENFLSTDTELPDKAYAKDDFSFVEKASLIIEKHLLDPDFSVEKLAEQLKISRSSLHRKLKAHTDQSASAFIRFVRLKKALMMLRQDQSSIDEISYAVGFNSASYFSACFKQQFGKSPKEYLRKNG